MRLTVLIALVLAGILAGPAHGATVFAGSADLSVQPVYTPQDVTLAGDEVVWFLNGLDGHANEPTPPRLQVARGDGPVRTIWDAAQDGLPCHFARGLAASPGFVAFQSFAGPRSTREYWYGTRQECDRWGDGMTKRIVVLRTDGTPVSVDGGCHWSAAQLSGDELICFAAETGELTIHDLSTGTEQILAIPTNTGLSPVAFAGRYVALQEADNDLVVWDRQADREAYRFDPRAVAGLPWGHLDWVDVAADGTVVAVPRPDDPHSPSPIVVAGPSRAPRALPFAATRDPVRIGDGLIAAGRAVTDHPIGDIVLLDYDGRVVSEPVGCRSLSDWDGRTLAWVASEWNVRFPNTRIRTEPAGHREPPRADCPIYHAALPSLPAPPPSAAAATRATSSAAAPRRATRCRVPRLRDRTLAGARRRLAAAGCRLGRVTRRGRHAKSARVRAVVVRQTPRAGRSRRLHARVRVVLAARGRTAHRE
jgi:hypothetical protein